MNRLMPEEKNELITQIIGLEWEMFNSIQAAEPSLCRQQPKTFRLMRWMSHSVHSVELLQSILTDLTRAREEGRNLMTEKYARMENKIPPLKDDATLAVIHRIADMEEHWMEPLRENYPLTFQAQGASFRNYTACELETYSDWTIEAYQREIQSALGEQRNLLEERYLNLFRRLGYDSLRQREEEMRRKHEQQSFGGC